MKLGVPQGSVLGPLLLNNDVFLLNETEICNTQTTQNDISLLSSRITGSYLMLETYAIKLSNWFAGNFVKLNEERCHLLVFDGKDAEISLDIGPSVIKESGEEKLLDAIRIIEHY